MCLFPVSFFLILIRCPFTLLVHLNNRKRSGAWLWPIFYKAQQAPGVKRVMNTQNQRQKTGRRGGILENKLVTACTVSSSRVLICSNLRGFVFYFNKRGYSHTTACTGPAGKTALPAKRRSQALCSPALPLGSRRGHPAPKSG